MSDNKTSLSAEQIARRISDQHLREHAFDSTVVWRNCPLDHLRQATVTPEYNLGELEILPVELQEHIIKELDIKSLLVFRRVSKQALARVNKLPEWRKITTHAPDVLRMAIGIETSHTFTLNELFSKLCQRSCDACGKYAPYLDVFLLERRCLNVGSICSIEYAPMSYMDIILTYKIDLSIVTLLPSFNAIKGWYGPSSRHGYRNADYRPSGFSIPQRQRYYSADTIRQLSSSTPKQDLQLKAEQQKSQYLFYGQKLSAMLAPWLSRDSMNAEPGISCEICRFEVCMIIPQQRAAAMEYPVYEPSNHMHGAFCAGWEDLGKHVEWWHYRRQAARARSAGWDIPEYEIYRDDWLS